MGSKYKLCDENSVLSCTHTIIDAISKFNNNTNTIKDEYLLVKCEICHNGTGMIKYESENNKKYYYAICDNPNCSASFGYWKTKQNAIKRWNDINNNLKQKTETL